MGVGAELNAGYMGGLEFRIVIVRRRVLEMELVQEGVSLGVIADPPCGRIGLVHSYIFVSGWARQGFVTFIYKRI